MRELYASEVVSTDDSNGNAIELINTWIDRHLHGRHADQFVLSDDATTASGSRIWRLDQTDPETGTLWRTEIAIGPPDEPLHATTRIRIRGAEARIAPLQYEFGTPAIVRTLLRELSAHDGTLPCRADLGPEIGASDIGTLVQELLHDERRLPIVVVSRTLRSGEILLDARELAKEVAGIAHVRVLASAHAGWRLTEEVGQQLSVWDGAIRVYFPGFSRDDEWGQHGVTFPDRIDDRTISRLRGWLGTLSAAGVPEHPAYAERRRDRRAELASALESADLAELQGIVELYEEDARELEADLKQERARSAQLDEELRRASYEVENLKSALDRASAARRASESSGGPQSDPTTVAEAMELVEELASTAWYRERVVLTPEALDAGRGFASYYSPLEMARAVQAVLEAGSQYHDNTLGMPPGEFFAARGYGYGARPTPHLKVDESTSPDQCLRIYWDVDEDSRTWTITSIGPHV
jgi:hypothetical protein